MDGRRVVVTRPAGQQSELVEALREIGAEPIEMPMITIDSDGDGVDSLRAALSDIDELEWLVVTSPNGARIVRMLHENGASLPAVAALGDATAATLGHDVEFIASRAIASVLVDEFPSGSGRIVVVQGNLADDTVSTGLAAKGWKVERCDVYRTSDATLSDDEVAMALDADAVVFASGSAVRNWTKHFGTSFGGVVVVIGPVTQNVAQNEGLHVDAVADEPSAEGIVRALSALLSQ